MNEDICLPFNLLFIYHFNYSGFINYKGGFFICFLFSKLFFSSPLQFPSKSGYVTIATLTFFHDCLIFLTTEHFTLFPTKFQLSLRFFCLSRVLFTHLVSYYIELPRTTYIYSFHYVRIFFILPYCTLCSLYYRECLGSHLRKKDCYLLFRLVYLTQPLHRSKLRKKAS